jgi:glycosyltransferase involved in cell wall biosynthesis
MEGHVRAGHGPEACAAEAPAPDHASITVVVTTYRRIARLRACLEGIRGQDRTADEVVVVVHSSDDDSAEAVAELASDWPALRRAPVDRPGLVAALNRGLGAATGDIVAFVDDDAVPRPDWLARIETTFALDERIAAVGGRDVIEMDGRPAIGSHTSSGEAANPPRDVGRIQWFGRQLGNHHLGAGPPRDVDVLKGVNMSYRRDAVLPLGFDERLRGVGAQVHSEMSICLPLRRQQRRVVYDPEIVVEHYPAPRPLGDQRDAPQDEAIASFTHNEALAILDHFGLLRRFVFALWGLVVGTTASPGLVVLLRDLLRRRTRPWARFRASQRGRFAAWWTHLTIRRTGLPGPR